LSLPAVRYVIEVELIGLFIDTVSVEEVLLKKPLFLSILESCLVISVPIKAV
jgi:hypothetical protein